MSRSPRVHQVSEEQGGGALDAVVREAFELSWGRARDLVRRGKVSVDDRVELSPTRRIRAGARVGLDIAARAPASAAELEEGRIVHVDTHVVVVDKPAGVSTIPFDPDGMAASLGKHARGSGEVALDELTRAALARKERRGGPPVPLGVVHRLDKETSGLLVFTRTWAAKKALMSAFRAHTVQRRYLAVVHGVARSGTIQTHFVENRGDGLRGSIERRGGRKRPVGSERSQLAVTHVEVVERLSSERWGTCSLVACRLETGRTHQIRIHLSEEGHPVVGDRVYSRGYAGALIKAPRLMLHAAELGFVHPASGREVAWTSEVPADMAHLLRDLGSASFEPT